MTALDDGLTALHEARWAAARDAFDRAATGDDEALALEGLAQACWWLDDGPGALAARERAYRVHRARGDAVGAARAATALAWDCVLFDVGGTVAAGWLARARSLLGGVPECAEHGWVEVRQAELALAVDRDPPAALAAAELARAVGTRLGDEDLAIVGLALGGVALVELGDVDDGMRRLDEAAAAATAGDVADLMWMGKVCCFLIVACNDARDVARATDWCDRVTAICAERDLTPLFSVCRTQYAAVLVAQGAWPEAERELHDVLGRLEGSQRASLSEAVVQLGELRRRQGRLDEAEALFAQAEFDPVAVAGRGEIRLERGDAAGALGIANQVLDRVPGAHRLGRVRALVLAVRAALALGDRATAERAAAELAATAAAVGTDALRGAAALARGRLAEPGRSAVALEEAVRHFADGGLRHDAALARAELARALAATGARGTALEHAQTAARELGELDAAVDARRARKLIGELSGEDPGPLTDREIEVLRLVAEGLSDQQIADRLIVSRHTVHRHVANIHTKLGQPSRAAAAAAATRLDLL